VKIARCEGASQAVEVRKFLNRIYNQGGKPRTERLTDDDVITLAGT